MTDVSMRYRITAAAVVGPPKQEKPTSTESKSRPAEDPKEPKQEEKKPETE